MHDAQVANRFKGLTSHNYSRKNMLVVYNRYVKLSIDVN